MNASCRVVVVAFLLAGIAKGADEPPAQEQREVKPAETQPTAPGWDQVKPELRAGILAEAKALGQTPDELTERMFLRYLADKVTETYAGMTDLTVECKVFVSVKMFPLGSEPKVQFDEAAPQVATVLWKMKPNQQFRVEAYDGDRLIWGMVSSDETKAPNQRSIAVQWTPTVQSKPYEEGYVDDAGRWVGTVGDIEANLLPGRCTLGMFRLGLIGGSDCRRSSWTYYAIRSQIREGVYEGLKRTADGTLCHSVRRDGRGDYYRFYIDPESYYLLQWDDLSAFRIFPTDEVIGVASHRFLCHHISNDPLPESDFEAPDPGERRIVDMDELFPH